MGDPIQVTYGAMDRRETLFFFDPFRLTVVGVDSPEEGSVLADPDRVVLGFDEEMVQTIMTVGSVVPVSIRKNGKRADGSPNTEVVFGRGRVLSFREAWRRLRKSGVPDADLPPVMAIKSFAKTEEEFISVMLIENLVRRLESSLGAARKAHRLFLLNKDMKRTAARCKVSVQTLGDWFKLLDLSPGVQRLIDRGEVAAGAALALLKDVPVEQHDARMAALISEGKHRGLAAESEAAAQRVKRNPAPTAADGEVEEAPRLPAKREVRRFRSAFEAAVLDTGYTHKQVLGLVDFLLDGKPLKGPLRAVWARAQWEQVKQAAK